MDLKAYRDKVRALAAERSGEAVYNGSPEHAAAIVERLFASASKHVRILTGDLEAKVYGESSVVQAAKQFLGHSDHQLDIIVEEDTISSTHPLVQEIGRDKNAAFYHASDELRARLPFHFATADDDCFRFEREKNSHTAVAAFGDKPAAENLNRIFETVLAGCQHIDMETRVR